MLRRTDLINRVCNAHENDCFPTSHAAIEVCYRFIHRSPLTYIINNCGSIVNYCKLNQINERKILQELIETSLAHFVFDDAVILAEAYHCRGMYMLPRFGKPPFPTGARFGKKYSKLQPVGVNANLEAACSSSILSTYFTLAGGMPQLSSKTGARSETGTT